MCLFALLAFTSSLNAGVTKHFYDKTMDDTILFCPEQAEEISHLSYILADLYSAMERHQESKYLTSIAKDLELYDNIKTVKEVDDLMFQNAKEHIAKALEAVNTMAREVCGQYDLVEHKETKPAPLSFEQFFNEIGKYK